MGWIARTYLVVGPIVAVTAAAYSYGAAREVGDVLSLQQAPRSCPSVIAPAIKPPPAVPAAPALPEQSGPAPEFALPWPPSVLAGTRPTTHDPQALLQRARRLVDLDQGVVLMEVTVPRAVVAHERSDLASFTANVVPVARDGWPAGVELARVPHGSLMAFIGLRQGDVVTSVNAYPPTDPRWLDDLQTTTTTNARALIEFVRDRRRVLYYVTWKE